VDAVARHDARGAALGSPSANYRFVGPEYFAAIGMPILRGRAIEAADRRAALTPAVVSSRVASALWPGEDALGREFTRANPAQRFQVVGIVADGRVTALEAEAPLMVYVPYWFNNEGQSALVLRSRDDALALVAAVRDVVREVDPDVAVARVAPLTAVVDAAVEGRRYQASLFTAFGVSALLIAIVGVYATTAYGVSRRRRELNIRVALGAKASQVFSLVLRQSAGPLALGLAGGFAGALAIGGLVASLLYEVAPRDPLILAVVCLVVAATGLAAAAAATFSGVQLEPAAVLRDD
jgi:ABC-type antimicrobial peptide transport system permease subunit